MRVIANFLTSAADERRFPAPVLPEIAFLGRSNVGKSSLINALVGKKLAKTSSIPGRTRTINFYELRWPGKPRPELIFTDLPGYGYAKLSRALAAEWAKFIDPYLEKRPTLALCLVLIDANVPAQEPDIQLLRFLESAGRAYRVVATKADKLSGNELTNALKGLREGLGTEQLIPFSAKSGDGRDQLWEAIRQATAAPLEPTAD
jgi:GTP-binding protein